ncbi:hypothetical protein SBV1_70018 [Verrucomicrobia bacterium]|nr:hypothetical protein SBV1_70018 [Verrucomicrobiota bacterium]
MLWYPALYRVPVYAPVGFNTAEQKWMEFRARESNLRFRPVLPSAFGARPRLPASVRLR